MLARRRHRIPSTASLGPPMELETIVVLEGDQTGQELLEESLRVLAPEVIGLESTLPRFDLSLAKRRATGNAVVHEAARGDPRARARPEGGDGHARDARRRRLAEPDPARGDRRQGDRPHRPAHPGRRAARRRARADLGRPDGGRRRVRREGVARGRGRRRGRVSAPNASSGASAGPSPSSRSGRPSAPAQRSSAARSSRSRRPTKGCSRRRWTPPRRAIPTCRTSRS